MNPYQSFLLPMQPASQALLIAYARGVIKGAVPDRNEAPRVLASPQPCADEVRRDPDGRVLVTCLTDLPGVSPAMVDWWFGWHLPDSRRYRLWHPKAHLAARVKEDRSDLNDDRTRYIGNVSYVDEYIGRSLKKLAISFCDKSVFGFPEDASERSTTVCASTSDRVLRGHGGTLVHHVVKTERGSQMRSGFWLGEIRHEIALVNSVAGRWLNTPAARRLLVSDRMALDLLMHCGEEMAHLARFLPALHAKIQLTNHDNT